MEGTVLFLENLIPLKECMTLFISKSCPQYNLENNRKCPKTKADIQTENIKKCFMLKV